MSIGHPFGIATDTGSGEMGLIGDARGQNRGQPPLDRHAGRPPRCPQSVHGPVEAVDDMRRNRGDWWTGSTNDAPNMAVAESNHIGSVTVKATAHARGGAGRVTSPVTPRGDRAAMHERPAVDPADEALALGTVLFRAHDAARHLEHLLELEAPDPRVAELMRDAKRIRKSIAALLVDVAVEASPEPTAKEA